MLSAACYAAYLYLFWRLGRNLNLPGPTLGIGQVITLQVQGMCGDGSRGSPTHITKLQHQ